MGIWYQNIKATKVAIYIYRYWQKSNDAQPCLINKRIESYTEPLLLSLKKEKVAQTLYSCIKQISYILCKIFETCTGIDMTIIY